MDARKKEEELRRNEKRRSVSRHTTRDDPVPLERSSSPPIPTMRGKAEEADQAGEVGGTRPASPGGDVVDSLASMRQNLERRRQSLQYQEDRLDGEWSGLAEL